MLSVALEKFQIFYLGVPFPTEIDFLLTDIDSDSGFGMQLVDNKGEAATSTAADL